MNDACPAAGDLESIFTVLTSALTAAEPSPLATAMSLVEVLCRKFPLARSALGLLLCSERGLQGV